LPGQRPAVNISKLKDGMLGWLDFRNKFIMNRFFDINRLAWLSHSHLSQTRRHTAFDFWVILEDWSLIPSHCFSQSQVLPAFMLFQCHIGTIFLSHSDLCQNQSHTILFQFFDCLLNSHWRILSYHFSNIFYIWISSWSCWMAESLL
jgi:hypothetical protein